MRLGGAAIVAPDAPHLPKRDHIMTNHISSFGPAFDNNNVVAFAINAGSSAIVASGVIKENLDGMPYGFSLNEDGIYQQRPGEGEDLLPVRICSPLIVKGVCRNLTGGGWGRIVAVEDPDGKWHELILDSRDVSKKSASTLNTLFDHGLELAPVEKSAQSVTELLSSWRPKARYLRSDRFGWADAEFSAFTLGGGGCSAAARWSPTLFLRMSLARCTQEARWRAGVPLWQSRVLETR